MYNLFVCPFSLDKAAVKKNDNGRKSKILGKVSKSKIYLFGDE
jgi:hypothetical protein